MKILYGSVHLSVIDRIKFFSQDIAQKYNFLERDTSAGIWFAQTEIEEGFLEQFIFDIVAYFRQQDIGSKVKIMYNQDSIIFSGRGFWFANDMVMFSGISHPEDQEKRARIVKIAQGRINMKTIFFSAKEKYLRQMISTNGWARKVMRGERVRFFIKNKEMWIGGVVKLFSDPGTIDGIYLGFANPSEVALVVPEQCSMIVPKNEDQCEEIIVDLILSEIPHIELAFLHGDR